MFEPRRPDELVQEVTGARKGSPSPNTTLTPRNREVDEHAEDREGDGPDGQCVEATPQPALRACSGRRCERAAYASPGKTALKAATKNDVAGHWSQSRRRSAIVARINP
jgi:hypothetical protein